jgi:hypothetical protein
MSAERQKRIAEFRRGKPIAELERKWLKANGRHSKRYFTVEHLDLSHARARMLYQFFQEDLTRRK